MVIEYNGLDVVATCANIHSRMSIKGIEPNSRQVRLYRYSAIFGSILKFLRQNGKQAADYGRKDYARQFQRTQSTIGSASRKFIGTSYLQSSQCRVHERSDSIERGKLEIIHLVIQKKVIEAMNSSVVSEIERRNKFVFFSRQSRAATKPNQPKFTMANLSHTFSQALFFRTPQALSNSPPYLFRLPTHIEQRLD